MKISICILTFNRKHLLRKLLLSLYNLKNELIEIIVVDNHSNDGTENLIRREFHEVVYVRLEANIGVGARNIGMAKATGDIIITIDDDIFGLNDNDLNNILKYFHKNKMVGALNFRVVDDKTGRICNWIHHCKAEDFCDKEFLTYEITEGAVAFRQETLKASGHYPEHFFLSHEGPDLAFRILESGYDVIYSPIVTVRHSHALEGRKLWFRYYYDTRNQFWLALHNFPVLYSMKYILRGLIATFIYALRDGYLLYWIKGVRDGLVGAKKHQRKNKLSPKTMQLIRKIDRKRPSLFYMAKKRLFRKEMRL